MTAITVEIDGKPTPVEDATWLWIAPCGCAWGAHLAKSGGQVLLDEKAVAKSFYETARLRRERTKEGFRFELRPRGEVMRLGYPCEHEPVTK